MPRKKNKKITPTPERHGRKPIAWRLAQSSLATLEKVGANIIGKKPLKRGWNYWHMLGPGLTTGAADDDPSGVATYSQAGAAYGFKLLWLAPFTFPLMAIVQEMCARIGLVTGKGLAHTIRDHFPRWVLYFCTILLLIANTFNIGADLGAMARATQLLYKNLDFSTLLLAFTLLSLSFQIFTSYERYAKYLKWLSLILFSYIFSAVSIQLNWKEILSHTFIPSLDFSKDQLFLIVGILGTTISPYLFFWQTSQEVEEEVSKGEIVHSISNGESVHIPKKILNTEIANMRVDIWSGMFLSNIVMFFIIVASAGALFSHGITNIQTAEDAALALRPFAGDYAFILFALGIIGTGFLAIPILAGASSYALSESFGWQSGLHHTIKEAKIFYGIIVCSMIIGLGINFIGLDPIKALLYSAVINGLVAPVILILILLISSNKKIMGEKSNSPTVNAIGWLTTFLMILAGIAVIISFII